ncbi:bifunctional RecB family nuclease/DEAD/DEAH box helicase [Chloroflexus sp.]|uniref:bifunctional RecB family nuclease/DEAD/DEAH box helicase n=1 Tax=Chloroflexus sp. TaxID=1904827 RepID=UPI0026343E85|nr:AAA domain-containing protein [uncultured Chloroflexus sp.]
MIDDYLPPISLDPTQSQAISPTDLAQFLRFDQCRRYLRLRLHERRRELNWLPRYGLSLQSLSPMLTVAGRQFEQAVEQQVRNRFPQAIHCAQRRQQGDPKFTTDDHNHIVVEEFQRLTPGAAQVLFQPRLSAPLYGWTMSGDVDLLLLQRDQTGACHALVVDTKSSATAKIEHCLQLACYYGLLKLITEDHHIELASIQLGVLYRGEWLSSLQTPAERQRLETERQQAVTLLGVTTAQLALIADPKPYLAEVETWLNGDKSILAAIAAAQFADLPFHLTAKCDGCMYNEICMRWAAEHDDLSLIPSLTEPEKSVLRASGIVTTQQLALLKELSGESLITPADHRQKIGELLAHPVLAARLDELIHRARAFRRWRGDRIAALNYLPYKGHSSFPAVSADLHPNLIVVYLDPLYDHTQGMLVLLGAMVMGYRDGQPQQPQFVIRSLDQPPQSLADEGALLEAWLNELFKAILEQASPAADGKLEAPIHLVVPDSFALHTLLDGLARHPVVCGATPLYDLAAQSAGFEAPMVTVLVNERRRFRNDPLAYDSLARLARTYGFDWGEYRRRFYRRVFDDLSNDRTIGWYTRRIRFNNQIPLEYLYAAWNALPPPPDRGDDPLIDYRQVKLSEVIGFARKRLEALALLAEGLPRNDRTTKPAFDLSRIAAYTRQARTLAAALAEFLLIERYVALITWGQQHLPPPEQRVLAGVSLIARYHHADQDPKLLETLAENERRQALRAELTGGRKRARLKPEQKRETDPLPLPDVPLRFRLDLSGLDCDRETVLRLTDLSPGDKVILAPRWSVDERLPPDQRERFTTTARQILFQPRATLLQIEPDGMIALKPDLRYSNGDRRFTFPSQWKWPQDGELYTIEADPNDIYGQRCLEIVNELQQGAANALYARLVDPQSVKAQVADAAMAGHERFGQGLRKLAEAELLHSFDEHQSAYIIGHGDAPTLLVQGPPGTGKSYTSAFALLARMQGLLAAGQSCRVLLSCKTHAATDVLLRKVAEVQQKLAEIQAKQPALFAEYFDERLLTVPLFRVRPKEGADLPPTANVIDRINPIQGATACFVAATPFAVASLLKRDQQYHTDPFADLLVLDEASQMNLAEACMAAIALRPDGRLIVVGDHRQMPPIVQYEWRGERRRTFHAYRVYASLFETLLALDPPPPIVRLVESFRVHRDLAAFLRRAIYEHDGIPYFSRRITTLAAAQLNDPLVAAALNPNHPLVVITHDEAQSQDVNHFEIGLIKPLIEALVSQLGLDASSGVGVVVPHRAQRLILREQLPDLIKQLLIEHEGATVDTIERFQGGERDVIIFSATESDPDYLRAASSFLLDPRRLNVALSRARHKLILIAARSVFQLFASDEEVFQHAQLWKQLLRDTCRVPLWSGKRGNVTVEVWGNETVD